MADNGDRKLKFIVFGGFLQKVENVGDSLPTPLMDALVVAQDHLQEDYSGVLCHHLATNILNSKDTISKEDYEKMAEYVKKSVIRAPEDVTDAMCAVAVTKETGKLGEVLWAFLLNKEKRCALVLMENFLPGSEPPEKSKNTLKPSDRLLLLGHREDALSLIKKAREQVNEYFRKLLSQTFSYSDPGEPIDTFSIR